MLDNDDLLRNTFADNDPFPEKERVKPQSTQVHMSFCNTKCLTTIYTSKKFKSRKYTFLKEKKRGTRGRKNKAVYTSRSRVWVGRSSKKLSVTDRRTDRRTEWVVESRARD